MESPSFQTNPSDSRPFHSFRILLWILLFIAASEFVIRGPLRYLRPTNWNDLAQYYAASRLWLRGQNFADPENFVKLWRDEVGATLGADTMRTHIAPLPGALVLLAPIGSLPWPAAKIAWLAVLLGSFIVTVYALIRVAKLPRREPRTIAFIAMCLALAPFHTGIASANQTILVVALCALGIYTAQSRHDFTAGLLFGAACSMKPHVAAFLVLYYLIQRRWRLFASAVGFTVFLILVAVGWMWMTGVHWVQNYIDNIQFGSARNIVDDFTTANPSRFLLINLQVPLFSITHSRQSANAIAFSVGCLLILVWSLLILRVHNREPELLSLAAISVIGLLPLYHRLYDASILAIPVCWCIAQNHIRKKYFVKVSWLLMAPFLLPTAALLQEEVAHGRVPQAWIHAWWWDCLVMPHQTWLLMALALTLLFAMATTRSAET